MAKDKDTQGAQQSKPCFKVACVPGNDPKNEHINKRDYVGNHTDEKSAVEAWKSLNGLDGIGVENWPLQVSVVDPVEEEITPAAPPIVPIEKAKKATATNMPPPPPPANTAA